MSLFLSAGQYGDATGLAPTPFRELRILVLFKRHALQLQRFIRCVCASF